MEKFEGFDAELEQEEAKNETVVSFEDAKKKRRPFHYWIVAGVEHKMKLTTGWIEKLEAKYKTNILNLVMTDGIPPLSVMLEIIQAALIPWEHGMKMKKVHDLYESWLEEDGSQNELLAKVIFPTLVVSGFFTASQAETIMKALEESTDLM